MTKDISYKKLITIIFFLSICVFLPSCRESAESIGYAYIDFDKEGILKDIQYELSPLEPLKSDSLKDKRYDISILIRYQGSCPVKNFPLSTETLYNISDSIVQKDFEIKLFDNNDEIKGTGNYGIYQIEIPLASDKILDNKFFISFSSPHNVPGILSLGIKWADKNVNDHL